MKTLHVVSPWSWCVVWVNDSDDHTFAAETFHFHGYVCHYIFTDYSLLSTHSQSQFHPLIRVATVSLADEVICCDFGPNDANDDDTSFLLRKQNIVFEK